MNASLSAADHITDDFKIMKGITNDDIAAAILVHAKIMVRLLDQDIIGHEICLAVRHGLFGVHANQNSSLEGVIQAVTFPLTEMGETLND